MPSSIRVLGLAVGLVVSSCGGDPAPPSGDDAPRTPSESPVEDTERAVGAYSAVVRRLIEVDHTLGEGPIPFDRVFIVDGVVEDAADPRTGLNEIGARFPRGLRTGMKEALEKLPPVRFVRDPESALMEGEACPHVRGNGALVWLGAIDGDAERVEVPTELYMGCLGAVWVTYVVERSGDEWAVTGMVGPPEIA